MRRAIPLLVLSVLWAACSNVVPADVERRVEAEKAERSEYQRAVRELWVLETTRGAVMIRLFPDSAPATVRQVRRWTEAGLYDGTWFHRAVREPRPFLLQAGDPASRTLVPATTVEARQAQALELGYGTAPPAVTPESSPRRHAVGAVALAVSEDGQRAGPQFIIALARLPHLDGTEPVFGQIVGGWSVIEELEVGDRIESARLVPPERVPGAWIHDIPGPVTAP